MKKKESEEIARTESLAEVTSCLNFNWQARRRFDDYPIKEVRELCIKKFRAPYSDSDVKWFIERIKKFTELKDRDTVFLLLRGVAHYHGELEPQILDLMIQTIEKYLGTHCSTNIKAAVVILCGKLEYHPELYNEKVRNLFCQILDEYDRKGRGNTIHQEESRILKRVFRTIGIVRDRSFLPLLEKCLPNEFSRNLLMNRISIDSDKADAEGLRLFVIQHLKEGLNK